MTWRTISSPAATTASDEFRRIRATAPASLVASRVGQSSGGLSGKFSIQRFASYSPLHRRLRALSHEAANVDTPPTKEPTNPEVAEMQCPCFALPLW
jgi:hypothetical protein